MKRRRVLQAVAAAACGVGPVLSQPLRKRVVWVSTDPIAGNAGFEAFRDGLAALGYVDGRDLVVETRTTDLPFDALEPFVLDVLASRPDIIVTQGPVVRTVRRVGTSIPVVFGVSGEPVIGGLIDSFARPGRNFTGISFLSFDLVGKRIELLRELSPGARRVAIIANPGHAGEAEERRVSTEAANRVALAADYFPVRATSELDSVFARVRSTGNDSIVVLPDSAMMRVAERIAMFSRQQRIPAISGWAVFARRGNVLSYGPVLEAGFGRLAHFVDRILKGAKPGEIPVELPSKVELVVNLAAARAIDLAVPPGVLARADEVIR